MISPEDKEKYAAIQELSRAGSHEKMVSLLDELVVSYPNEPSFRGMLANGLWEVGDFDRSINEFKTVVKMAPLVEAYSLGLFHCLWDVGRVEEAFAEMNRFLTMSDSDDYRKILSEIDRMSE